LRREIDTMKAVAMFALAFVFLGLLSAEVRATSLEVEALQAAAISPSEGSDEVRLLVSFKMPGVLEGKEIDFACVSFEADCSGGEGAVSFQAFALTKGWDEKTVSWTGSWDSPGGDWDRGLSSYWISEAGKGKAVYLDVTDFANQWLKEPSKNFGIIVKVSGPFLGTFALGNVAAKPKLSILY
jgi:hypothetical protein